MTINRNKIQDVKTTDAQIYNRANVIQKDQSWLGHTKGSAILDYELLKGTTVQRMMEKSGRGEGSTIGHIKHLEVEHGLTISQKEGYYKLQLSNLKGKVGYKNESLFKSVQLIDIYKGVEDFRSKGFPEGFGPSITFDVKINNAFYPPKPIMAYANLYAEGRKPENYFSGGRDTPCFKAYGRLGIEIVEKGAGVNYFWVNQGSNYNIELQYGCVCATQENLHHHKRLREMKVGDVIINYAKKAIRAISKVKEVAKEIPRPYLLEGKIDLVVKVDYDVLEEPITIDTLKSIFTNHVNALPKIHGPFNNNLGINQAYCLAFNKDSFDLIFNKEINFVNEPETKYHKTMNIPLNQILYGPPGTGKTYNTLLKAAEIVSNREINDYDLAQDIFNKHLGEQIEFITFHQNYSYEDFIQGLRPDVDNGHTLTFDRKDGIFLEISKRALENLELSEMETDKLNLDTGFNLALQKFIDVIEEGEKDFHIPDSVAYITEVTDKAFRYQGKTWGHSHLMKFNDLKEFFHGNVQNRQDVKNLSKISGLARQHASYFLRIYSEVKKFVPYDKPIVENVEKKNFVIVIDEINRANISRVFGELITLIEPDKRSNGAIPMRCKLPSGEDFTVPSNLYIIGTMNTADKSIALLDIALRRRFVFESMYPKYEISGKIIHDVEILEKINKEIIKSKGHDFQIGHAYFMNDNENLIDRMNLKVIPLLLEYYMNDEKEVKSILQTAGLEIDGDNWPLKILGRID